MQLNSFYSLVTNEDLTKYAHQWRSLVACAQERLVYRKALEYLEPGARCLDWGCGSGHFSYYLSINWYRPHAYALDDRPALLERCRIDYTKGGDVTALPFESESFDAVFSVGVLEHVYERGGTERGSLAELARILKPGGTLLIFHLPNRFSWLEWAVRVLYRSGISKKLPHEKRYTESGFRGLLAGTDLSIVESGRYHFLPRSVFNRLPRAISDAPWFCAALDMADDALSALLNPICQNWYFILHRRATGSSG